MESKKIFWINISSAAITVLISILAIIIVCLNNGGKSDEKIIPETSSIKEVETVNLEKDTTYILYEFEGVIGVFDCNRNLLEKINIPVVTLPREDRERLNIGIAVSGKNGLEKAKEDFSG